MICIPLTTNHIYCQKYIDFMGLELKVPERLVRYVTQRETISIEDVMRDFNVSRITAKNYLSRLARMELVKRIGRGLYQQGKGPTATVDLSPELSKLSKVLREHFRMAELKVWSIGMLADYAHYTVGKDLVFVETDKVLSASIRDALIERGYHAVLRPENRDFREYAYYDWKPVFILERREEYGLVRLGDSFVLTPERIWLDLYYFITRKELSFPPSELGVMFANMLRRDGINFNRLLRYAQRRKLRDEMVIFLYSLKQSSLLSIPDDILVGRKGVLRAIREMVDGARE